MNAPGILRLRLFAARHRRALIVALVAVALLSTVGAGWEYANPGRTAETEHRYPQRLSGAVGTSVAVTGNTTVHEQGTTLTDRRVYLFAAGTNLTLDGVAEAPEGSDIHQRLTIQYRATRDGRVIWEESRVLAAGTSRRIGAETNVSAVRARAERIQGEFGAAADISMRLGYVLTYETDRYEGTLNSTVPLTFTRRAYIIDGDLAVEETRRTTVTVQRRQSPDLALIGLLAAVGLLSAMGAAVMLLRHPLPDPEVAAEKLQHRRYAEWISTARIPIFSADQTVEMETLADLINMAIDSNERVLHDPEWDIYGILNEGGKLYWYASHEKGLINGPLGFGLGEGDEPGAGAIEAAFDASADGPGPDVARTPGGSPEPRSGDETAGAFEPSTEGPGTGTNPRAGPGDAAGDEAAGGHGTPFGGTPGRSDSEADGEPRGDGAGSERGPGGEGSE